MRTSEWFTRGASLLRPGLESRAVASDVAAAERTPRTTRERLKATLRQHQEALSPRVLRRTLVELQAIVDPRVSEIEGTRLANAFANWYAGATTEQRRDCWLLMSEQFAPDPARVKTARER